MPMGGHDPNSAIAGRRERRRDLIQRYRPIDTAPILGGVLLAI